MFVITGGSRGIGAALATHLACNNHPVLIIGRDEKTLQAVAHNQEYIQILEADVATTEGRETITNHLKPKNITTLIHNAGVIEPMAPITDINIKNWQHILDVNLTAPLFLTQALFEKLKGNRVLHIGSGAAYFPVQGWAPYCVSKAALAMLNRSWQLECPEVATTSVMPGIIDTEMQAKIRASQHLSEDKHDFFIRLKTEGKLLTPETVASFLSWLLLTTDKTRYVSQEWDIYDTSHHVEWLKAPHEVPSIE